MHKIKLAVFDVDGTLTKIRSIWEYLHRRLGIWETEGLPNLDAYLSGGIDYYEFARRDAQGYKGYTSEHFDNLIERIPHREGIEDCFNFLRSKGIKIALLSTGLDLLLKKFQPVDFRFSNELLFRDEICLGKVRVNVPIDRKIDVLNQLIAQLGIGWNNVMSVGDSEGDLEVMEKSLLSVAVNPSNSELVSVADYCIDGANMFEIVHIYRRLTCNC